MKLTMREKVLLSALIFLVVTTGYYYFVVGPMLEQKNTLTSANAQLQLDIARMAKLAGDREAILAEISALKHRFVETKEEATLTDALLYLEASSSASNVMLRDLSLGSVGPTGGQLTLTLSGTYPAVVSCLRALETPQWITINSVRLTGGSGADIAVVVSATLYNGTIDPKPTDGGVRQSPFTP